MSRPAPASLLALILAAAAPAADWKGKPDPAPKDRPALTADPVADVTVPKFGFTTTVAFADQGGPFVALVGGGGSDGGVRVFDLRTGKPSAEVAGEFRIQKPVALSPDGRYLAGAAHGVRGSTAAVIDLKGGKVVHEFPAGRFNVEWLGFAGPDRLLVTARDRDTGVTVYDLKTGNPGKTLSIGRPAGRVVSPGGAYLAVGSDAGVRVFRLETGDEVGTLKPSEAAPGHSCQGLAFSPDGKQLAGLFGFTDHKVSVWSLVDGKLARTVTPDKSGPRGGSDNKLEWAADGSAWLLVQRGGDGPGDRQAAVAGAGGPRVRPGAAAGVGPRGGGVGAGRGRDPRVPAAPPDQAEGRSRRRPGRRPVRGDRAGRPAAGRQGAGPGPGQVGRGAARRGGLDGEAGPGRGATEGGPPAGPAAVPRRPGRSRLRRPGGAAAGGVRVDRRRDPAAGRSRGGRRGGPPGRAGGPVHRAGDRAGEPAGRGAGARGRAGRRAGADDRRRQGPGGRLEPGRRQARRRVAAVREGPGRGAGGGLRRRPRAGPGADRQLDREGGPVVGPGPEAGVRGRGARADAADPHPRRQVPDRLAADRVPGAGRGDRGAGRRPAARVHGPCRDGRPEGDRGAARRGQQCVAGTGRITYC